MLTLIYFGALFSIALTERTAPGIERTISDGVNSIGYKLVYGDEDMTIINEAITDVEKKFHNSKTNSWKTALRPLEREDVKCLMSVDRYCSKDMGDMKQILISAVTEDCAKCSNDQKDKAGKIVASMMTHDPVAWKMFLSRLVLQIKQSKPPKNRNETDQLRFKLIGEPEEIPSTKYRYTAPGFKVKVKRYAAEIIP